MSDKIIEAEAEVVSTKKTARKHSITPAKTKKKKSLPDNPFAGMQGMEGMPDLSAMFGGAAGGAGGQGMPDLSAMFGKGGMPDLSKLPGLSFKHRVMFKFASLASSPKLRFLKSKWSIPIWGIIAIIVVALLLTVGVVFLIWKLLKGILGAYLPSKKH